MNQKGFSPILILVGVFVVILVATGGYYFGKLQPQKYISQEVQVTSVTPRPTSNSTPLSTTSGVMNLQNYENDKYKYSFSHPKDMTPVDSESEFVTLGKHISIYVSDNSFNLDCHNFQIGINTLPPEHCPDRGNDKNTYEDIQVGTNSALKISGVKRGIAAPESFINVVIAHDNLFYELQITELPMDNQESSASDRTPQPISQTNIQLFNQILSTFKFTK